MLERSARVRLIALISASFLLAGMVDARSQQPSPSAGEASQIEQQNSKPAEQPANTEQRGSERAPFVVKVLPTPKTKAEARSERKDRKTETTQNRWLMIFSGLVALFTLLLFGCNIFLWVATNKAANAAKDAAEHIPTVERAWVFAGPDATSLRAGPELLQFRLHIENHGKTPGFVRVIWAAMRPDEPFEPVPKYEGKKPSQTEMVLGPGKHFLWPELFYAATDRYFYGYIRYTDIFHANHVSRFCVRLVPEDGRIEMAGHRNWNIHYTDK